MTIDKSISYFIVKGSAFQRRPTTLIEDILLRHLPRAMLRYTSYIGIIALTEITPILYSKENSRVMAHLLYQSLQRKTSLLEWNYRA